MRLMIISGRSGSGKSVALHALEDLGYYCIDNLPLSLLPELDHTLGELHTSVAVSIDSRNLPKDISHFQQMILDIKEKFSDFDIIYLDAQENSLLKRFSETRRKHPLTSSLITLREAIRIEEQILAPIADFAEFTIDTSNLSQHELHQIVRDRAGHIKTNHLQVMLQSFGFKYGLPPDADFVFDIRFLPNPYWIPELRFLTGLDQAVQDFLAEESEVQLMLEQIHNFLTSTIPKFKANNRCYMTVAIGCTGGQHRSVYLTQRLSKRLCELTDNILIRHREIKK